MVFRHVDTSGAHVIFKHCHTALLLHYPACGELGDQREGRTIFVVVPPALAIFTAALYGHLLYSLAKKNSKQRAQQNDTRTH